MTDQDLLRRSLRAAAGGLDHPPDRYPLVAARAARLRRRHRAATLAGGLGTALLVAAVAVLALPEDRDGRLDPTGRPPVAVGELVAVTRAGAVVLVSADTGLVTRTVARLGGPAGDRAGVALAPDRRTAYVSVEPAPGRCRVYAVGIADGARRELGAGHSPRVSPDGGRLAWITGCDQLGDGLAVGPLAGGPPRLIPAGGGGSGDEEDPPPVTPVDLEWSPDGSRLLTLAGYDLNTVLRAVDPDSGTTVASAPLAPGAAGSYTAIRRAAGRVVLGFRYADDDDVANRLDGYDPATGRVTPLLSSSRRYDDYAVGPGGGLVYRQRGALYRWDGAGEPRRVRATGAADLAAIAW